MFGGGGGLNPRKLQQMMKQMGIDVTELDAEEVIIRTPDEELVFTDAQVQRMDAQGQATFQVVGEPESRPRGEGTGDGGDDGNGDGNVDGSDAAGEPTMDIPESDIDIVTGRTGASREEARAALEAENGDLAAAVSRLE